MRNRALPARFEIASILDRIGDFYDGPRDSPPGPRHRRLHRHWLRTRQDLRREWFRSGGRRRRAEDRGRRARPSQADALLANAGRGLGKGFLDQDFADLMRVINTNITGTLYLLQKVGREMRERGSGRILIVGSIAGFMPGTYQAVYNGTKAFLASFSRALRQY